MSKPHSTDDFADGKYRPHGRLEVHVEGNVCIYRAEGPFNLEAILALGKARRAIVDEWGDRGSVSATIVQFYTSMLMSQDALDAYTKGMQMHLKQAKPNVAVAWVVAPTVEGRSIMLRNFEKIFASLGIPWKSFEKLDEARIWVQSKIDAFVAVR